MKKVRTSLKYLHGKLCEHQLMHTLLFTEIHKGETLFNKQETNMLMQWFLNEGSRPKNGSQVCSDIGSQTEKLKANNRVQVNVHS